jgi:predicted glycogen debranching enzyme
MEPTFENTYTQEYLLTNGIGGYCAATISGANSRRYHGLLVAAFNPPTERMVLVSKVEERIQVGEESHELSANQYPGLVHPQGFRYLEQVETNTRRIRWTYRGPGFRLEKTLQMVQGENTTLLVYRNLSGQDLQLEVMPFLVYKDYHGQFHQEDRYDFYTEPLEANYLKVYATYGARPVYLRFSAGHWEADHAWYTHFEHLREAERGFDFQEDGFRLGMLRINLPDKAELSLAFSAQELPHLPVLDDMAPQRYYPKLPAFIDDLIASSRQFVVHRQSTGGNTLIAGYHWFTDWGRDTMIALRGISIATGRQEEARSILKTFLEVVNQGMLPNRFPDYSHDQVEYNTIDATLWLFIALYEYNQHFGDKSLIKEAMPKLEEILQHHVHGTRFHIGVTEEGLLYGGEEGYQLTWMDAKVGDYVVTPRIGCPVEVNLLWYNALCMYQEFRKLLSLQADAGYEELAKKCKKAFVSHFLLDTGYLCDVVIPGQGRDESLRPNQVYALSLPFSPLTSKQQQAVLKTLEAELLTPYGLRTLDRSNPQFRPVYAGNAWERDTAYHQGTVWPFLWGEWALAYLKMKGFSKKACAHVWEASMHLQQHFYEEGCLWGIAEIFDGLEPASGKGCVQQAWSVGALLNVFLHKDFDWSFLPKS